MSNLTELTERITSGMVRDDYNDRDIHDLVAFALKQSETIQQLADENKRLTDSLAVAGRYIEQLEPLSHLKQYEGNL